ncbi:MAG: PIG-L family deacetylase [Bryobacterales bacterium]|nr:PIG-L family deacetylase [Bryobacterales bacterium]
MRLLAFLLAAASAFAADPLPPAQIPSGKMFLVMQPHHDDHTTDYGMGGLIARLVDEGYQGVYVRSSNDEKDGRHGYALNDAINLKEAREATTILGIREVVSLGWRNDYMDSIPLKELRAQLILLIRKYRPDVVLGHDPWAGYDRNPDHRKVSRAMADAVWLAGLPNVHPEQLEGGLLPHRVPYVFLKARVDYGRGHWPNVAVWLTPEQVRRKALAFETHRNVYAHPSTARAYIAALADEGLVVPEIEGMNDQQAAVQFEKWFMEWISRKRGEENGADNAEVYWFRDEFDHLPGLRDYLRANVEPK